MALPLRRRHLARLTPPHPPTSYNDGGKASRGQRCKVECLVLSCKPKAFGTGWLRSQIWQH
eukprot:scaffold45879_cov18-Tisochrysis_lutea.AAC.1